jgi:two-component system chemotaxis response regulator CheB
MQKIRVFIVDDSAVVRQVVSEILTREPGFELVGTAPDPIFALEKMQKDWPDVIILDVEMPRMDGITFLKQIMSTRPTPVVICSTLVGAGTETAIQAMQAGAAEIIAKPTLGLKDFLHTAAQELLRSVRAAAASNPKRLMETARTLSVSPPVASTPGNPINDGKPRPNMAGIPNKLSADAIIPPGNASVGAMARTTERIIAIGTSTGGTIALEKILTALPRDVCGIAIVQHMPEAFTASFAKRLNQFSQIEVAEGSQDARILPGQALIAPGGKHMILKRSGAYYHVDIHDGPPVNRHRPSVDVLFRSFAKFAGSNCLGIIMTGMGDDGAKGLKEMRDAGSLTVAQDEASCVVFGMPKEAIKLGGAMQECSLDNIANLIVQYSRTGKI